MDTAELSRQITELQDIEAIKQLAVAYCDIADDDHNEDRIVSIFAEDGIWEGEPDRAEGHAEIRALFEDFRKRISFSQHNVLNPHIRVDGDTAYGTWNFFGPFTYRESGRRCWIIGRSEDDYVKIDDTWLFKHHRGFGMEVPLEEGWPSLVPPGDFANFAWRGIPRTR